MFDTEKFISLVQEHPCLWDKGAKEYSDRNLREEAWRSVAKDVVPEEVGWESLDAKEMKKESKLYLCK